MSTAGIGSLIGPLAGLDAGAASAAQSSGQGADIAIGDLTFKLAITDTNPYQRATAQFKKDQLDAGTTVGDQSLTGWWTRGQLSFHHGAGVTYYEVSEGETVINRYKRGVGINPFTPGAVTLCKDWTNATTDSHSTVTYVGSAGSNLTVLDNGTVYYGALGGAGTTYTPSGGTCTGTTTGNGDIYTINTDKTITRIGLAETVVSAYAEQGFETSADSWTTNSIVGTQELATSVATSTTQALAGTHSLKVTWPAPGATGKSNGGRFVTGLTVGVTYSFVCSVYVPAGNPDVRPFIGAVANGTTVTTKDAWTTCSVTFTANSTSHYIGVSTSAPVSGQVCYIDRAVLYRGNRSTYDTGAVPIDVIYSAPNQLVNIFYAKDRLFVVDLTNTFYALAPNPGTIPTTITGANKIFAVGGDQTWCLTDTPGPVLLGNGNRIFAVTVDASTGDIPTLSGPVQVADLPPQESVRGLASHLGFIVIVTTKGTRIGILSDAGTLTYGPLLFEWTSAGNFTAIARIGSTAVVAGGHALYQIDLSEQIGNGLEFAWSELPNPVGSEVNYGATTAPDGTLVAWGDGFVKHESTSLTPSGTLTTGYHRFATLEPKRFGSVKIRATGTGGTIAVARVSQDGVVAPLYTLDVALAHTAEIGLNMADAVEAVALQFTLTPKSGDATVGPTLLGYQLRAMPEPQRQRMIRIPVQIKDVERRRPTRSVGHEGSAWERLSALEDAESSGASVLYRDFRTGETASVYIESVEFTGETPPTERSTGFGGVAFLTLRKLA